MKPALDLPPQALDTQSLKNVSDADLIRSYWVYNFIARPWLVKVGSKVGGWSVRTIPPARWAVSKTIFAQFCGGESVADCRPSINHLIEKGIHTILDYSVEGAQSEENFNHTQAEISRTIKEAATSKEIAFSVFKVTGLGRSEVLEAISKDPYFVNTSPEAQKIAHRVNTLCQQAHDAGVRIFIDAEETWLQPAIDRLAIQAMLAYNRERPVVFNTYQLYLQDGLSRLQADAQKVWEAGCYFGTKLVRGAYMEKEAARAQSEGRPSPINPSKEASDAMFDAAAAYCIKHIDRLAFCLGTHNAYSCTSIVGSMQDVGLPSNDARIWFAQLLGMSDNLSYPLAAQGFNVAKYVPYGPVKEVVPYLIRRAQENTTVAGQSSRELRLIEAEVKRRGLNTLSFFLG
jgi:proline dehydrogenase